AGKEREARRGSLGEEPRGLAGRHRTQREARGEANRARGRRDEVREVVQGPQVAVPAFGGDQLGKGPLTGHEGLAAALDSVLYARRGRIERAAPIVAREQDP